MQVPTWEACAVTAISKRQAEKFQVLQALTVEHLVVDDKVDNAGLCLGGVNVVLHIHRAQHLLWREAVQLAARYAAHEGRLRDTGENRLQVL